jgi:lipopolysaccharide/colanic/teichoic acid biosynthesis glycosyltransferase
MFGITGWVQVNERNALTWDEKLKLNLWYVDHLFPCFGMKITSMTFFEY